MMKELIVTIHGTGDGDILPERVKWWQPGSPFEQEVASLFASQDVDVRFDPFIWSGKNSEAHRRRASRLLAKRMRDYDRQGLTYHLVGHSHGGSVIEETLVRLATTGRSNTEGLKSITTIGTPFIETRPSRVSIQNFLHCMLRPFWLTLALAALSLALVQLAVSSSGFDRLLWSESIVFLGFVPGLTFHIISVFVALLVLVGTPRLAVSVLVGRRRWTRATLRRLVERTETCRQHLWHKQDEAISGLGAVDRIEMPVFRGSRLSSAITPLISPLLLLSAFAFFVSGVTGMPAMLSILAVGPIDLSTLSAFVVLQSDNWLSHLLFNDHNPNANWAVYAISYARPWLLGSLIMAALLGVIALLCRLGVDFAYRHTFARALDAVVTKQIRRLAYGLDVGGEFVQTVRSTPSYITPAWRPLPTELSDRIAEGVDREAARTVAKLRGALGRALISTDHRELAGKLAGDISWRELVHTSYFDHPSFARLVAYGMIVRAKRQPILSSNPDFELLREWHLEMAPEGPTASG